MRQWLICAVITIMTLVPTCLPAQDMIIPESIGLGYSLTAGAAFAVSNKVRNDTQPILSISWYGATGQELGSNATIGLSGTWIPMQTNANKNVNLVPILLNYKVYGYAVGYRLFTNLGAGVIAASDEIPEMKLKNGINFGWTAGFGIDLTNQLFGQFRFIGSENPSDDGFAAVEIGYRF